MIKFDFETYTKDFIKEEEIKKYDIKIPRIKEYLNSNKHSMGWYCLDELFNKELIDDIKKTASYIRNNCEVFLVVGIGGSYVEAKSIIDALNPYFYNQKNSPAIYFIGNSLSSNYYYDLIHLIKDKNIIINIISKSGTTLETEITYNLLKKFMNEKYSKEELRKRIIITTDRESGVLREETNEEGYKSFVIPNNIGGRYSAFTPVGLLPMAVANLDLMSIYEGVKEAEHNFADAFKYAVIRDIMYNKHKLVEAFVVYEPKLKDYTEWLKQLYGESLGKEGRGILPISLINTKDLHSMGQFVQQGNKIIFETVINITNSNNDIKIEKYHKSLNEINLLVSRAVSKAHLKGSVLNNIITIDKLNEYNIGYLTQFFMISCVISGYLEEVNPFNQDGVEEYKRMADNLLQN